MANPHCAWCNSTSTYALADRYGCFECDRFTNMDGTTADNGFRYTSPEPHVALPYEKSFAVSKNQSRKRANLEGEGHSKDELTSTKTVGPKPDDDRGTGPYEDRTVEQLKNVARSRNLPVSGTKDELIDSLRGY